MMVCPMISCGQFCQISRGFFWIGMHDGGVCYFDPYTKEVKSSYADWDHGIVNALEQFEDKELWIGTEGDGVFRLDFRSEKITPIKMGASAEQSKIHDLHKDIEGNIWIVSNSNSIISGNRQFEMIQQPISQIQAVMADYRNQLWVGTQDGLFIHRLNDDGGSVFNPVLRGLKCAQSF